MKLLLDTHILLWAASAPHKLHPKARTLIEDEQNELFYSPASLWEILIKNRLGRSDFQVDPRIFRTALEDHGYRQIPITSEHVLFVHDLPPLHKDPLDHILVAQASIEGMGLLTMDQAVMDYGGTVILDDDQKED
jgi:PIN domain nuclease of toxin-antitoxin system